MVGIYATCWESGGIWSIAVLASGLAGSLTAQPTLRPAGSAGQTPLLPWLPVLVCGGEGKKHVQFSLLVIVAWSPRQGACTW